MRRATRVLTLSAALVLAAGGIALAGDKTAYGVPPGRYGDSVPGPDGFSGGSRAPDEFRNDGGGDRFRRERGHEFEWRGEGWDRQRDRERFDRTDGAAPLQERRAGADRD